MTVARSSSSSVTSLWKSARIWYRRTARSCQPISWGDLPGRMLQASLPRPERPAVTQVIGRVDIVAGSATVQHANGVVENLEPWRRPAEG